MNLKVTFSLLFYVPTVYRVRNVHLQILFSPPRVMHAITLCVFNQQRDVLATYLALLSCNVHTLRFVMENCGLALTDSKSQSQWPENCPALSTTPQVSSLLQGTGVGRSETVSKFR
jgi:hypothetical protein